MTNTGKVKYTMISIKKVLLFSVYTAALTNIAFGQRQSLSLGGGAGGGSRGRVSKGKDKNNDSDIASFTASNSVGSTTTAVAGGASSSATTTLVSSGSSSTTGSQNSGFGSIETTMQNVGSSENAIRDQESIIGITSPSTANTANDSNAPQNFGTTGSLAIREVPVTCPICDAVPDKSYDESLKVNVGQESWTCGYLQETVQDTDQHSIYRNERSMCRQSQIIAEEGGCCGSQVMYIRTEGEMLNDPCSLCDWHAVPDQNKDKDVDTKLVGTHSCGGLEFIMARGMFNAQMCPMIKANIRDECCSYLPSMADKAAAAAAESPPVPVSSMLRGAAMSP